MPFLIKKYRKIFIADIALIIVFAILLIVNVKCSNCLENYLPKLLISFFTVCIAIVELGDVFQKKRRKKRALYFLIIALFLTTVWDTGKESIDFREEVERRNNQITTDSIRFVKIIDSLSTSLSRLEEISGSVISSFNEVLNVKKSVGEQKPILNNILYTTAKSSEQTELLTSENQPNLVIYDKHFSAYFDNNALNIEAYPVNIGNGQAYDVKIFYQVLHISETRPLSLIQNRETNEIYPKRWTKLIPALPGHSGSYKTRIKLKTDLTKKFLQDNGGVWILVYSISYSDFTKKNNTTLTKTVSGKLNENGDFDIKYDNINLQNLKPVLTQLDYNFSDFIFVN